LNFIINGALLIIATAGDKYMNEETCAVKCMLKNFFELDVFGGAIRLMIKWLHLQLDLKLHRIQIDIHVEKALYEYNGIYPAINQFFLEKNSQDLNM
jgi:hypothetical protein